MTLLIWQFFCKGLSSFNLKGFYHSYAWSCRLFEGRTSFRTRRISGKLCGFWLMFSTSFTSLSVLLVFLVLITFFVFMHGFLFCLSNIDLVLSINQSANVFVFGGLKVHHKARLTCSGGTDRPFELCYNFTISNDLNQMVDFPTRIPDCDSHCPALSYIFFFFWC